VTEVQIMYLLHLDPPRHCWDILDSWRAILRTLKQQNSSQYCWVILDYWRVILRTSKISKFITVHSFRMQFLAADEQSKRCALNKFLPP